MSLSRIFDISASALAAQSQRLNTVASNLANADSVAGPNGQPYRARQVVFEAVPVAAGGTAVAVAVSGVIESDAPARQQYDPKHPSADKDGYVAMSNVNVVEEMVNMMSASRAYQTNADVMNTAKTLLQKALAMGS